MSKHSIFMEQQVVVLLFRIILNGITKIKISLPVRLLNTYLAKLYSVVEKMISIYFHTGYKS